MSFPSLNILQDVSILNASQLCVDDYAQYFSRDEIMALEQKSEAKRHQSALGRLAVKNAIRKHEIQTKRVPTHYQAIEVVNTSTGQPQYKIEGKKQSTQISISHTKSVAIGGLSHTHAKFGLDIEKIRTFDQNTVQNFLTDSEWSYYQQLQGTLKSLFPTLAWCSKEATLKALGVGLYLHPKEVVVELDDTFQNIKIIVGNKDFKADVTWTRWWGSYIIVSTRLHEKLRNSSD